MSSKSSRPFNQKLSYRIAEETQLLAEEKWLIEALEKIKKQRNCLQIERLHLEGIKTKLELPEKPPEQSVLSFIEEEPQPSTSGMNTPQAVPFTTRNSIEFETPIEDSEFSCNNELLDLTVSKSVFTPMDEGEYAREEYEEEFDDDGITIDINMFMNGRMAQN